MPPSCHRRAIVVPPSTTRLRLRPRGERGARGGRGKRGLGRADPPRARRELVEEPGQDDLVVDNEPGGYYLLATGTRYWHCTADQSNCAVGKFPAGGVEASLFVGRIDKIKMELKDYAILYQAPRPRGASGTGRPCSDARRSVARGAGPGPRRGAGRETQRPRDRETPIETRDAETAETAGCRDCRDAETSRP